MGQISWCTFLLPVIYIATIVITLVFLVAVIEGSVFPVEGLLEDSGLSSDRRILVEVRMLFKKQLGFKFLHKIDLKGLLFI